MNAKNMYAGTQTEKNLWEAFAGESQARNKYTYFASVAKKQGYEQIAALFLKTADNEKEHAKLWFKELREYGKKPEIRRGGRKPRMDGYVRKFCRDSRGGRLLRTCGTFPLGCRGRTASRGAFPFASPQYSQRRSVCEERSHGVGMPQLRACNYRKRGALCMSHVRPSAELL